MQFNISFFESLLGFLERFIKSVHNNKLKPSQIKINHFRLVLKKKKSIVKTKVGKFLKR